MRSRERGLTLVEIMVSMGLAVVGLTAMLSTMSSAVVGAGTASRLGQAQLRAESILEAIRLAPSSTLTCLVANVATSWSTCESDCKAHQTGSGSTLAQSCIFTTSSFSNVTGPPAGTGGTANQTVDRSGVTYSLVYDSTTPNSYHSTFVIQNGPGNRVYDAQVTIGWSDDPALAVNHWVTLRSGVFN